MTYPESQTPLVVEYSGASYLGSPVSLGKWSDSRALQSVEEQVARNQTSILRVQGPTFPDPPKTLQGRVDPSKGLLSIKHPLEEQGPDCLHFSCNLAFHCRFFSGGRGKLLISSIALQTRHIHAGGDRHHRH